MLLEAPTQSAAAASPIRATFGVPYDRGAHWIYMPDINPVAKLARAAGLDIYPAPPGQRVRIGRRYAREGEMEEFLAGLVRANRAIADAARKGDVACAQALPKDLGDWRPTIEFVLGPYRLRQGPARGLGGRFRRVARRDIDAFCRQGFGALLAKLAAGLPVQLSTPATRIDWSGRTASRSKPPQGPDRGARRDRHRVDQRARLRQDQVHARAAAPHARRREQAQARQLRPHRARTAGQSARAAARRTGVREVARAPRTAAIFANVSGTPICMVEVGGSFGRELSAKGEAAMVAFALDWLADLSAPT